MKLKPRREKLQSSRCSLNRIHMEIPQLGRSIAFGKRDPGLAGVASVACPRFATTTSKLLDVHTPGAAGVKAI